MDFKETLDYLFNALPMFQRIGAAAFKKDLSNTLALCEYLGNPQHQFKSVHVAGTNGKGSTSHAIASILQESGYKVGLYTSPHLKSFTERIKINGKEISEEAVVDFVAKHQDFMESIKPSFFEMTVVLAFDYFANQKVDVAIIEVGMGGRLDSTNVIQPLLGLITNIGMDHTQFLGDTLEKIAGEKAGIIKKDIPVIVSQTQSETTEVFKTVAENNGSPIFFAEESFQVVDVFEEYLPKLQTFKVKKNGRIESYQMDLLGRYQKGNLPGILMAAELLNGLGFQISDEKLKKGLKKVIPNTGLKGRWQQLDTEPLMICDTGHNVDGIIIILDQLNQIPHKQLFMVLGVVEDKDLHAFLNLLPRQAYYIFCQAKIPRALPASVLFQSAQNYGLEGETIEDVNEAIDKAKELAGKEDLIFIGGSTFVVAEINNL
ncbi:bifunctional folylpolyglutamate synthase/dihydrofolate synthase [Pararhodonellum marinum]|uniref:bifunctional folylpolyglutamate synthase/dihydrofolate synthase n=1 Tax=Pararhodonellum marinum TaxID=2755358 RepID=UPI00188E0FD8|nr:folylpolyglutamate synthase/dihydrofolate synthase family protein [Pararhodonellum marinum]